MGSWFSIHNIVNDTNMVINIENDNNYKNDSNYIYYRFNIKNNTIQDDRV